MFSDAVEIVESLGATLHQLSSTSENFEGSYSYYERRMVNGFIEKMGEEEFYHESNPGSAFLAVASGLLKPIQNSIIDNKIQYVKALFSMVPDNQVSLFYSELSKGLDYILDAWDDSEQDPKLSWYQIKPQRVKNRFTFRVVGY